MASGDLRAARVYASALFRTALGRNEVDEMAQSLSVITAAVATSPELMTVLHHPRITRERKKSLLAQIFQGRVHPHVEHFLFLLVEKDRADIIPNVAEQFNRLLDEHRRETDAEAVTAVPMTDEQRTALQQKLESSTGYKVRLTTRVDEEILGGMIVRVGDQLFDGSIAMHLKTMRDQLRRVKVA